MKIVNSQRWTAPVLRMVRPAEPAAPRPRPAGTVAEIDRARLARAGFIVEDGPSAVAEEFRLIKHQLLADLEKRAALPEERRRAGVQP